ncbi:GYDIA family GHMP kinase [Psychroflexus sediminis]|uniref:Mevalonate kinase n=1 Tax=Psychroflexus sediminis TaxID=470826 RepID=A0A1G7UDE0_9FLAO|nr:GYDIA family GHMP kinase [Psychroflexus sediminis]SDG45494.1 Mevalonate kinase [Psychroflexus sediminis]
MDTQKFYSHGKLLITGEYLVLDGAKALAIPCKFGQHLNVIPSEKDTSRWLSYDHQNRLWLDIEFDLLQVIKTTWKGNNDIENRLFQVFREINRLNPTVFTQNYQFKTHLEFPKTWGLGTSSTLIANLAKWADVNPYALLANTFGGSGYDIACADSDAALVFQLEKGEPQVETAEIPEAIKSYIHFVYLEEKQNSREAIANYKTTRPNGLEKFISEINKITQDFQNVESLEMAQELIDSHEQCLSEILQIKPVQSRLFPDFKGHIKSLGAWGGDFVMVLSEKDPTHYFRNKGLNTILSFEDMSL